ncbi:MAG: hypothetical protein ACYC04_07895 [Sulfurovum sp.]
MMKIVLFLVGISLQVNAQQIVTKPFLTPEKMDEIMYNAFNAPKIVREREEKKQKEEALRKMETEKEEKERNNAKNNLLNQMKN